MTREEYKAKLKGLHAQMDCDLQWEYTKEYIASLEARIAELEAAATVWVKYEHSEQVDHARPYMILKHCGVWWLCYPGYPPAPPEE